MTLGPFLGKGSLSIGWGEDPDGAGYIVTVTLGAAVATIPPGQAVELAVAMIRAAVIAELREDLGEAE